MTENNNYLKTALEQAIAKDGGLAVFQHYGFEPSRRAQKVNPFREERTSSFFVTRCYGKIIFKDFGDDEVKGDCWKFVKRYENADNRQAFQILCRIYGLNGADFWRPSPVPRRSKKPFSDRKKNQEPDFHKKIIDISFKDFSEDELAFWQQKGGVDLKTLQANQVKSVSFLKLQTGPWHFQQFGNVHFVFAIEIVPNQTYKLYMPEAGYRIYGKSKTIFLPNLEAARSEIDPNYAYAFGLDTLRPNEPVIICAGEADCLALKAAGYNAFTLGDERSTIPDFILKKLKDQGIDLLASPQEHAVLYDTDYTGLKASQELARRYGFQQWSLPKLKKQIRKGQPKPHYNDFCDYWHQYGIDHDLCLMLGQRTFSTQDFTLHTVPTFKVKQYLTEKSDLLAQFIRQHKHVQIDADAGIGKTYALLDEVSRQMDQPIIFAVPFAIQVEQIEKEYAARVPGLVCFSNQYLQKVDAEEQAIFGLPVGKVNVCTFDRIQTVAGQLARTHGNNYRVVVDESHLLTSEYDYRTKAIHDVLEVCHQAAGVVYMSATPDYSLCKFSGFRLIRFKREINPEIKLHAIDYKGDAKKVLLRLLLEDRLKSLPQPGDSAAGSLSIVRLNNKTLAKMIAEALVAQGFYKKDEIDFVFSEKRKGENTESKKCIVNESRIPEQVKLLFVTSCFDCGINILNTNISKIISFETRPSDHCKDTLKQLIARFRNLDKVSLWVCKPEHYKKLSSQGDKVDLYQRLVSDAQSKLELLPYNNQVCYQAIYQSVNDIEKYGFGSKQAPRYIKANPDISAIHKLLMLDKKTGNFAINYNYIRFILKDYECKCLSSDKFYEHLLQELPHMQMAFRTSIQADQDDDCQKY
ncbi:MAG: DEAD/DEAH box helicase family protein [Bacteroidia bacterium]|nr:DEAD/DEAH box helicase family protein [Bacteroidia bacterium]